MGFSKAGLVVSAVCALGAGLGAGACSSSDQAFVPRWAPGSSPSSDAVREASSCAALAACCDADAAGDLYCDVASACDDDFQVELNYGYCSGFTYDGFAVLPVSQPVAHSNVGDEGDDAGEDSGAEADAGGAAADASSDDAGRTRDDSGTTAGDAGAAG